MEPDPYRFWGKLDIYTATGSVAYPVPAAAACTRCHRPRSPTGLPSLSASTADPHARGHLAGAESSVAPASRRGSLMGDRRLTSARAAGPRGQNLTRQVSESSI